MAHAYFSRSIHVVPKPRPRLQMVLSENDAALIRNVIRDEIQLSEARIKTDISEFKMEVKRDIGELNNRLETLSKQSSMLSEESVRGKVIKLNGESWADPITFKSLDDLAAFIYPSLSSKKKNLKSLNAKFFSLDEFIHFLECTSTELKPT